MVSKLELLRLYRWALEHADGRLAALLERALGSEPLLSTEMLRTRIVVALMRRLGADSGPT